MRLALHWRRYRIASGKLDAITWEFSGPSQLGGGGGGGGVTHIKLVTINDNFKGELAPLIQLALDRDVTVQLLDYFLGDTQTEADADVALVCVPLQLTKHLENLNLVLLAQSLPRVRYCAVQFLGGLVEPKLDGHEALCRKLEGILRQIHDDLRKSLLIGPNEIRNTPLNLNLEDNFITVEFGHIEDLIDACEEFLNVNFLGSFLKPSIPQHVLIKHLIHLVHQQAYL